MRRSCVTSRSTARSSPTVRQSTSASTRPRPTRRSRPRAGRASRSSPSRLSGAATPPRAARTWVASDVWGGGGGGMWGGGGGQGAQHWSGTGGGAKFMGIPPEIEENVQFLVDKEPEFDLEQVPFTQVYDDDQKPFTLRRFLAPKKWPILGVLILIAMEVFCQQYGPRLVANAVNEGIAPVVYGGKGDF